MNRPKIEVLQYFDNLFTISNKGNRGKKVSFSVHRCISGLVCKEGNAKKISSRLECKGKKAEFRQ